MHFALQQSEGWQERAILLLQMLLECLITEDWFLTVLGTRLCEWTLLKYFGFLCVSGEEDWCAHCVIDQYVTLAKTFGLTFDRGLLFPRLKHDGTIILGKRWKAHDKQI